MNESIDDVKTPDKVPPKKNVSVFVRAAVRCGCRYLAVGGPSSRLEQRLTAAGKTLGYKTEVFTTPTGVFVSAITPNSKRVVTFVGRVKDVSFSLAELEKMESVLQKLSSGHISPEQALSYVRFHDFKPTAMEQFVSYLGSFLIGSMFTLMNYGSILFSLIAGAITLLVHYLSGPLSERIKFNPVFSNFASAVVGFGLSAALSVIFKIPMDAVALGSLIILAPGLMITTSISEVAEQNYVSGIAKLMKSGINLIGMLIAYLLVLDVVKILGYKVTPLKIGAHQLPADMPYLPYIIFAMIGIGMCLSLQVPKKAIPGALLASFSSWWFFNQVSNPDIYVTATYFSALIVGVVSLVLAAIYKLPSQIFSTPGILTLVPGVLAMTSFHSLSELQTTSIEVGLKVLLIASAIVFALFTARFPFMLQTKSEYGLDDDSDDNNDSNGGAVSNTKITISPNSDSSIGLIE